MYKVMIADDEMIIRQALVQAFDWNRYGMTIVGQARNGIDASTIIQECEPDVCFLDIQMPFKSGLELAEEIAKMKRKMICVIVTGHDVFEYARKAVHLNVFSYVLKPIDEGEFNSLLAEIKAELDEHYNSLENGVRKDKMINDSKEKLRHELLLQHLTSGSDNEIQQSDLDQFDIDLPEKACVMLVNISYPVGIIDNERVKEEQLHACKARLDEYFREDVRYHFITIFLNKFVVIFDASKKDEEAINHLLPLLIKKDNRWGIRVSHAIVEAPQKNLARAYSRLDDDSENELKFMPMVKKTKDYVEANYQNPDLKLSSFAKDNRISMSYLSKLFKKETGKAFIDYLIDYRIKKSIDLLINTDIKIREVSEKVGYSSQHYYCEAFKRVTGVSPIEFRRKNKQHF